MPSKTKPSKTIPESQLISLDTFKKFISTLTFPELIIIQKNIKDFSPCSECLEAVRDELEDRGYDPDDLFFEEADTYL